MRMKDVSCGRMKRIKLKLKIALFLIKHRPFSWIVGWYLKRKIKPFEVSPKWRRRDTRT